MKYPEIYLDADDVERGYYVYAHRCKATNAVFYVGKGKKDRAWSAERSRAWQEHVGKLAAGFEVILLHENLTENEAIDLERVEIEANGGPASTGGRLVNWIPGEAGLGFGVAAKVTLDLGKSSDDAAEDEYDRISAAAFAAYEQARKYKTLTAAQKNAIRDLFDQIVMPAKQQMDSRVEEYFEMRAAAGLLESPGVLDTFVSQADEIERLTTQIRHRKMKYSDFCDEVDVCIESLMTALALAEEKGEQETYLASCRRVLEGLCEWSGCFAEGTIEIAIRASDAAFLTHKYIAGNGTEQMFAAYLSIVRRIQGQKRADGLAELRADLLARREQPT